jgi:TolB-like protein
MAALVLKLLGGFEVYLNDGSALALSTKSGQALLAYLALTPSRRHARDKVAALLWEDRPDEQARTSLRQTLAVLRKTLPLDPSWLSADDGYLALSPGVCEVDVATFERLAKENSDCALAKSAALYGGDLLDGFHLRSEGFLDWLRAERERLHELAIQVHRRLLAIQSAGTDREAAIETAGRLLSLNRVDETAHRALMRLHMASGRTASALRQYDICRDCLRQDLDVSPEPETESLYRAIVERRAMPSAGGEPSQPASSSRPGGVKERDAIAANRPSVAVLPFVDQSGDPAQSHLSDGITEDIITELSRYHSLLVIARSSSFQFRGAAADIEEIRHKLGARYIVEGSVRNIGDRIRVSAQLIDTLTKGHLWAERYDRPVEDIFSVQDDVAAAIAATLEGRIAARGAESVRRKPTKDWSAYDYFLQGRELVHRYRSAESVEWFERALTLDPDYVHAHAWKSMALVSMYVIGGWQNSATLGDALMSARRAVELDEADGWSHQAMGYALLWNGRIDMAGTHFAQAIRLNPSDASIACDRANWLLHVDKFDEALQALDEAMRRDPFPPTWAWEVRGSVLYQLKRYEEAAAAYSKVGRDYFWMPAYLAASYAQAGQRERAAASLRQFLSVKPDITCSTFSQFHRYGSGAWRAHILEGLRKAGLPE